MQPTSPFVPRPLICVHYDGDLKTQMTEFNRIKALDRGASPEDMTAKEFCSVSMEMYQRGYRFVNVDIQHSEARRFSIKDGAFYYHHS